MSAPLRLFNDKARGALHIEWADGDVQDFPHGFLRRQCLCAFCRARRIKGEISLLTADVHITELNNQGYGVQIIFSDGHDKGIFPWGYLAALEGTVLSAADAGSSA